MSDDVAGGAVGWCWAVLTDVERCWMELDVAIGPFTRSGGGCGGPPDAADTADAAAANEVGGCRDC